MNILFMSLGKMDSIQNRGIYMDLLRVFVAHENNVCILSAVESDDGSRKVIKEKHCRIIKVVTGRIQKTNMIEKGINTVLLENRFKQVIKTYLKNVRFDLVLFPTPPITLVGAVEFVKKRDGAKTYLLLKDIFPQNAVDIGMMGKTGVKGILYQYFRHKEKKLYALSDHIGCMSQANVNYVLRHNPEIAKERVEICPNSIEPVDMSVDEDARMEMRRKYGIPEDKMVFVYGGNLGKPQGIPFLIECMENQSIRKKQGIQKQQYEKGSFVDGQKYDKNPFFLIVGSGTEYGKVEDYIKRHKPQNVRLMKNLPKEDYDRMVGSCDVGLIFLDHRFTIPNFPSRLLSYMQAKLPILAVTDPNTDIGKVIVDGGFGWWCESNDVIAFGKKVKEACVADRVAMGEKAWEYLNQNYTAEQGWRTIMKSVSVG